MTRDNSDNTELHIHHLDVLGIVIPLPLGLQLDGFHKITGRDKAMACPRPKVEVGANG